MRPMDGSNTFGLDVDEMCLVTDIQRPAKVKVPEFEKYKGNSLGNSCQGLLSENGRIFQ